METVQIKYDNFKKFIVEAAPPGSFWLLLMASVPLETFLRYIWASKGRAGVDHRTDNRQGTFAGRIAEKGFHPRTYWKI
jgi:hypothetical protein